MAKPKIHLVKFGNKNAFQIRCPNCKNWEDFPKFIPKKLICTQCFTELEITKEHLQNPDDTF